MGINQAIYTSSARGIEKGGGMGIHTYNRDCTIEERKEFELGYCQYVYGGGDRNISELPVKLLYGKTERGRYMQACVTYIGKDYDKVKGRMGNFISHMYSFTKDSLFCYPVELYGSPDYRTAMRQEEVDGSMPVDYLPQVQRLRKGGVITVERVQDFLNDDRMDMFCHLMAAVLKREKIHKIIIYDTHEHILLWLGAIQFALPLQCAAEVSYSSFEHDPTLSEFDIRGAVLGMSRGSCAEYAAGGQFLVFDGIQREYPLSDISSDYFVYGIKMGLSFSYESMTAFFDFIGRYDYQKADTDLLYGFQLYQMIQGGMERLKKTEFDEAVMFETRYGSLISYRRMLAGLFEKLECNTSPDQSLIRNICFLLSGYLKKQLREEELAFVLGLVLQLDQYMRSYRYTSADISRMWYSFYGIMAQHQDNMEEQICRIFRKQHNYHRLGEYEAYLCHIQQRFLQTDLAAVFARDWGDAPMQAYGYFDQVVDMAVSILRQQEEAEGIYEAAIDLFLWLQDAGKGQIAGKGCERLIGTIERLTEVAEKKQFVRKRKYNAGMDKKYAKCAVEVQNYCNMQHVQLPVTKIRLLHFGNIIIRACEEGRKFTNVKEMQIYHTIPIVADDISSGDFQIYISQLAEIMDELENDQDEYLLIFTCLQLDETQKKILVGIFMDYETAYQKKKKEIHGVQSLLSAVRASADSGYVRAMAEYISDMKASRREKLADAIREECGRELYTFWIKLENMKMEKETKKGHFIFGRRKTD